MNSNTLDTEQFIVDLENTEIAFRDKSNKDIKKSIQLFRIFNFKLLTDIGAKATSIALSIGLPIKYLVKALIYKQFVGGETLDELHPTIEKLAKYKIKSILEYGVEGKSEEKIFDRILQKKLGLVEFARSNQDVPVVSCKITGLVHFRILEKLHRQSELSSREQSKWEAAQKRVLDLSQSAYDANVSLFFDAEESWIQNPIDELIDSMMERFNKERVTIYNTYQLYLTDRLDFLERSHDKAVQNGYMLGAKLVRGAYMEKERNRARVVGYESPIQPNQEASDNAYNQAIEFCINHIDNTGLFVATHNEQSCLYACQLMVEKKISFNHPHIQFSQLYGMGEHITYNLAEAGFNASKYIPYGPVREVIPYLTRRAEENSSVAGQVSRELSLLQKEYQRRLKSGK